MEDIAVIGVGLRFPGNASSPEKLWDVLEQGESQWCEIPKERINIAGYFHPSGDRQGSIPFRGAHLLKEDVSAFDAPFFSVPAEDAQAIDPQQRMLLEVSYEALENAGLRKEDISGTDACVYVGSFVKDYEQICLRDPDWAPQYAATGNGVAIMANRISYFFNLHGPSMTIDTGCSGSLVSVHLGAQSLRNKESSIYQAIAAGAGMILTPSTMMPMTALNFLSPDGKCFTFDSRANGYGRGEGIGVVVMKRLSDAIRDNDTIRAVIRGSSVNQDGRTTGITLPSKEAQVANIKSVYANAGLDFDQTAYVECHGTGTQAGDWRELKAISETLAASRSPQNPILVGSVKPNIGHLEGAAGVAGMIKGVLVLERGKIPPNINFEHGNPTIDFDNWKVKVPRSVMDWPIPGLRRVSVNCFGFGGTNAHVILDEAPGYMSSRGLVAHHSSLNLSPCDQDEDTMTTPPKNEYQLFCYSAGEKDGVTRTMSSHFEYIQARQDDHSAELLKNYSYTLGCRRSVMEWKGFVLARSVSELTAKLETPGTTNVVRSLHNGEPRVAFIFSGQGSSWAQMGLELMGFDVFRKSLEEASAYTMHVLGSPFDLLREMFRQDSESALSYPHLSQPATTAIQVALIDLFHSFGIDPKHVVGHSSGEIAAAYAGGAISRFGAWEVAYYRGMAAFSIPLRAPKLKGAMMAVGMSVNDMKHYLESEKLSAEVACVNSHQSVTISGRVEAIKAVAEHLASRNIFHRVLDVQTAYHSSHMRLVSEDYKVSLSQVKAQDLLPGIKMFSSVTGRMVKGQELDAQYWTDNMTSPVQYDAAIREMMSLPANKRPTVVIELSPRAILRSPTSDIMTSVLGEGKQPAYFSVMQPKTTGLSTLLSTIGELWVEGAPIKLKEVVNRGHAALPKCLTDLPPYPWNHSKSYWHESHLSVACRQRELPRQDLIGALTADSISFEPRWRGFLRVSENPWIQDHQVQKTIVYPAAGMISMVLEGASQIKPESDSFIGYQITDMNIAKAMMIPNTAHGLEVALNMKVNLEGAYEFSIYSKQLDGPWEQHASGFLHFRHSAGNAVLSSRAYEAERQELTRVCKKSVKARQLYELLDTIGMNYGPTFQNMSELSQGDGACLFKVCVPDTKSKMPAKFEYPHVIHPATLDSMFHSLFAIETSPMVPTFFKSVFVSTAVSNDAPRIFSGYATASKIGLQDADARIVMSDADSTDPRIIIEGLHLTALNTSASASGLGGFLPNFRNLSTEIVWKQDATFASFSDLVELLDLLAHKYPELAILQVGGSLKAAVDILDQVASDEEDTPRLSRFTLVDESTEAGVSSELSTRIKGTRVEPFVECKKSMADIDTDYHLIIHHGGPEMRSSAPEDYLKVGGILIRYKSAEVKTSSGTNGHSEENGAANDHDFEDFTPVDSTLCRVAMIKTAPKIILLTPEVANQEIDALVQSVTDFVNDQGESYSVAALNSGEILQHSFLFPESVIISLLDIIPSREREQRSSILRWDEEHFNLFKTVQRSAKGLIWLTRGAHMEPSNLHSSAVIGLARVLMSEDPRRSVITFDLDAASKLADSQVTKNVMAIFSRTFCEDGRPSSYIETEYAEKNGKIFVPRLKPIQTLNQIIEGCSPCVRLDRSFHATDSASSSEIKLSLLKPGLSDGSWQYTEFDLPEMGPDDIDIQFLETVLTFQDVETILGRGVASTIGVDVKGTVKAVGKDVTTFAPGDEVVALVPEGSIKSTIRIKSRLVQPSTGSGSFPCLTTSAYYALVHMGRARPDKTVLIRGGASAHGITAVEFARLIGTKVLASVIGDQSGKQREILESHGVSPACIFDNDSNDFVHEIRNATDGKGVDVVYDTTTARNTTANSNTKCVKRCGIIVQLTSETAHSADQNINMGSGSVTVVNFDIRQLLRDDEAFAAELFEAASKFILGRRCKEDTDSPTTITRFEVHALGDALRRIQEAPYQGLCTVSAISGDGNVVPVTCKEMSKSLYDAIDPEGTYLLAGGLGGLGKSISELLVAHGAKHLAFISRSGASSDSSQAFIEGLREQGVDANAYCADICDEKSLRAVIQERLSSEMSPIRGVFQCAAVIHDGMFDNMAHPAWSSAMRPKVKGSWNLVKALSEGAESPFFIFLASSAGIIGNRGQANYAAGNSFQDALAHHCRLQGKYAVSVDLGPVLEAGMLTGDEDVLDKLRSNGFYGIRHNDFLTIIKHAITKEMGPLRTPTPAQIILGVGTGGLLLQNKPADPYWSRTALYAYLNLIDMPLPDLTASATDGRGIDLKTALGQTSSTEDAASLVRNGLAHMLAKAMNLLPEEVDVNKAPNAYGVDSLVAVGVRNWILGNCAVEMSVFEVLSNDTISQMANTIAERGGYGVVRA
ncbi:Type I Iterative PKS [Claviceps sp. LM458 group G5]|nr:Type I Iterative PKS [Claviceps sp. LM458 group G5]